MNAYRNKPLKFPWPPVVYGLAVLAALALGRYFPMEAGSQAGTVQFVAGCILIATGIGLDLWAVKTLLENHTTVMPHRCTTRLVTSGPFHLTRNPIYLGYTLLMAGLGLVLHNPWFLVTGIIAIALTTVYSIRKEERHLLSRFGFEFELYCRNVTRWI